MAAAAAPWWGFHRLDDRTARRLVRLAHLDAGDLVLDVGAGTGALTQPLAATGAAVIAVELHVGRAAALRRRFAGASHVRVVRADARDLRLPRRPFSVVANPPFAATTALMRRLLAPGSRLQRAVLVLPAPTAARWSSPGAPARARWGREFTVSMAGTVDPRAFRPPAPARAAIVLIQRRQVG